MDRRHAGSSRRLVLVSIISLVAVACNAATQSTAPSASAPGASQNVAITPEPVPTSAGGLTADGKVLIRWFVGLGTGAQPDQIADEQAVVQEFNSSQDKITLSLEIYQNTTAYDILSTQIAAGTPPDIIGPVGFRGFYGYGDQLLDLAPFIEKTGFDVSGIDPKILNAYKEGFGGQVGIPFAIYPSFIYYNKDLFAEAGAAEPPHKVGEKYERQGLDLGDAHRARQEADGRQGRQRRDERVVRQGRHGPVGLLHAVDRPARLGHPVRAGLARRR